MITGAGNNAGANPAAKVMLLVAGKVAARTRSRTPIGCGMPATVWCSTRSGHRQPAHCDQQLQETITECPSVFPGSDPARPLPGPLAATRTGLAPASDDEFTQIGHIVHLRPSRRTPDPDPPPSRTAMMTAPALGGNFDRTLSAIPKFITSDDAQLFGNQDSCLQRWITPRDGVFWNGWDHSGWPGMTWSRNDSVDKGK
jgi:hypothetical protein